jgi:hypothetical protein
VRRRVALWLVPLTAAALALPASAGTGSGGSYRVRVVPDPTVDNSPFSGCGVANAWVVATDVGESAAPITVPAGKTLSVELTPDAQVFAGDEGMVWRLRLEVAGREVARSSGPAWRTEVHHRANKSERVWVLACNRTGYPDATVTYAIR